MVNDGAIELFSFSGDIKGRFNLSRSSDVMPTDTIPDPCLITNPILSGVAKEAANTKFPSITPFSSSTTITNFPIRILARASSMEEKPSEGQSGSPSASLVKKSVVSGVISALIVLKGSELSCEGDR